MFRSTAICQRDAKFELFSYDSRTGLLLHQVPTQLEGRTHEIRFQVVKMTRTIVAILSIAVLSIVCAGNCAAQTDCPCGPPLMPDWMRRTFMPQEIGDINIRPSCQSHDDCYASPGSNRKCCDQAFLTMMLEQCECSEHPRRCKMAARGIYFAERTMGWRAHRIRQGKLKPILPITH